MFDRLEAVMGIADEAELLGKQVFNYAVRIGPHGTGWIFRLCPGKLGHT